MVGGGFGRFVVPASLGARIDTFALGWSLFAMMILSVLRLLLILSR